MSKKLSTSIMVLHQEIKNTLWRAITIIEEEGNKLKAVIDNEIGTTYLTSIRIRVLHQKNQLIELQDLMRTVLQKEEKKDQSIN